MKPSTIVYALVCGATVFYVMMANARGIVPFNSSMSRAASGSSGVHTGTAGFFHK